MLNSSYDLTLWWLMASSFLFACSCQLSLVVVGCQISAQLHTHG